MKGGEHRRINKAMYYSHHIKKMLKINGSEKSSMFICQDTKNTLAELAEKIFGTVVNYEETLLFHSANFKPKPRNLALRKAIANEPVTSDLLHTPPSQLIGAGCDVSTEVVGERKMVCITQPTGRRIYNWQVDGTDFRLTLSPTEQVADITMPADSTIASTIAMQEANWVMMPLVEKYAAEQGIVFQRPIARRRNRWGGHNYAKLRAIAAADLRYVQPWQFNLSILAAIIEATHYLNLKENKA